MGGDTFPNTLRLSRAAFSDIVEKVLKILSELDIVTLYCSPKELSELKLTLYQKLEAIEEQHNGDHLSFLSPERYQIDVLVVPECEFDSTKGFYSNGDFSYCLGKMIYKYNLKWSSKGLSYRMAKPDFDVRNLPNADLDLILTRNTKEAFSFLGFSESTIEDLLDDSKPVEQQQLIVFLQECRFYRLFLENESARKRLFNKHRERRPMVRSFFDYCQQQSDMLLRSSSRAPSVDAKADHVPSEEEILTHFNLMHKREEMKDKVQGIIDGQEKRKDVKSKFNGEHVEKWCPGISKRQIGFVFATLRRKLGDCGKQCSEAAYHDWVFRTDCDEIKKTVAEIYKDICDKSNQTGDDS
ncbi:uncharacterized protein LOC142350539 isoform X2 [Convolutriloba macropyga]|uniref:uncharacterized protein LOC142350539 isoform X2 n=1 Tax=Convolutriloba macropyga TaxID=536237 RepID=UPI003F51D136